MRYAWNDQALLGIDRTVCPQCNRSISKLQYKDGVPHFLLAGGSTCPDYLQHCSSGLRFLVSEKTLDLFEQHGITGYSSYQPVTTEHADKKSSIQCPNYYCLDISGKVELDFAAMHLKKKRKCPACGQFDWSRRRFEPRILDENVWDGSDLCRVDSMPGWVVCSQRTKELIVKHKLKGFSFICYLKTYKHYASHQAERLQN